MLSAECRDTNHGLQSLHTASDLPLMQYVFRLAGLVPTVPLPFSEMGPVLIVARIVAMTMSTVRISIKSGVA
jgi:hypothetical protein